MKILIFSISLLIIVNLAYGQADPKDVKIDSLSNISNDLTQQVDSLTKNSKNLTIQIDSLKKINKDLSLRIDTILKLTNKPVTSADSLTLELVKYKGVYNAIKEKVLHYDFDPTRSAYLIDSLQAARDSVSALFAKNSKSSTSQDSLSILLKENSILKVENDSMKIKLQKSMEAKPEVESEKEDAINNLKQLKELLDLKIITEVEFVMKKKKYVDKL